MPGPRPTLTNGRIKIEYNSASLGTHVCNLDVRIDSPLTPAPFNLVLQSAGVLLWTDAVDRFVLKAKPLFSADFTFTQATLYRYDSGAYIAIDSYSIGVAGTGGGGETPATEETYFFYDEDHIPDKIIFLEQGSGVPLHLNYAGLGASRKAFVDDVLLQASPSIGDWYRSKSDQPITVFLAVTTTFNRRLRRKRGQA